MSTDVHQFYERYSPMVLRRCRRLLRDEEEAAEAMQDVFVEVLRREESLNVTSPSSFLYRTATNVCLNRLRTHKRRPRDPVSELIESIAVAPEAETRTLAQRTLDRIFQREPASTRVMAVMHLVDGMTLAEVAAAHDMSVSGVRKRLRVLKANVAELQGAA